MNYNGLYTQLLAIDASGGTLFPSLEATYGPYKSIQEAYNAIEVEFGAEGIPIGLTVGIKEGNSIKEYWFNGGTSQSNLVEKAGGGGSGGGSVNIESISTDSIKELFK